MNPVQRLSILATHWESFKEFKKIPRPRPSTQKFRFNGSMVAWMHQYSKKIFPDDSNVPPRLRTTNLGQHSSSYTWKIGDRGGQVARVKPRSSSSAGWIRTLIFQRLVTASWTPQHTHMHTHTYTHRKR